MAFKYGTYENRPLKKYFEQVSFMSGPLSRAAHAGGCPSPGPARVGHPRIEDREISTSAIEFRTGITTASVKPRPMRFHSEEDYLSRWDDGTVANAVRGRAGARLRA